MRISGFSFVRNGLILDYPIVEALRSILPIVDELVVAVGAGQPDDRTREAIEGIGDPKICILDTVWDEKHFRRGAVNAVQTDIARLACSGDWLFYLQADEVVHERWLEPIESRCRDLLDRRDVEGLLFRYRHFWGDYDHCMANHAWYPYEIRVIRNLPQIRSWHSAQSFRWYDRYEHPWQETDTRKLRVAKVDAEIHHYGWVRSPRRMQAKNKALNVVHAGPEAAEERYAALPDEFDYGDLSRVPRFDGTHPVVMRERIAAATWTSVPPRPRDPRGPRPKHEQLKYRVLSFLEKRFFGGEPVFGGRNYRVIAA